MFWFDLDAIYTNFHNPNGIPLFEAFRHEITIGFEIRCLHTKICEYILKFDIFM